MSDVNFHYLQSNLSETYAALKAKSPEDEALSLYATSSNLYFQGCLMGKFIRLLDRIWCWIFPCDQSELLEKILSLAMTTLFDQAVHTAYDARQRRIWDNMRQIDQIWNHTPHPPDPAKQRERYAQFLAEELKGSVDEENPVFLSNFDERSMDILGENEVRKYRHIIVNFHQATYLFWSLFCKDEGQNVATRKPVMHFVEPHSKLTDRVLYKALHREGRWVQMEGVLQQPIPVALLAKLCDPETLTVDENRQLKSWVHALNKYKKSISQKLFSCVLEEIINVIRLQGSSSLSLPELLVWLDRQGCQMIHHEDPEHMDWREQLRPGDVIDCNGKELVLGKQLSPDKLVEDKYKIFELANYPDYVVKIAVNRFVLLMEDHQANQEEEHWGVRLVKTAENFDKEEGSLTAHGLDREGRCVVQEKLVSSLENIAWTTQNLELSAEDEKGALVFANHLFCMSQWKATPQNLSLAHLMWDQEGVLKSTRLLKKGPPNYNEWEELCEKAAQGNLYILNFLMHVSKLHQHKVGMYYRNAVEHTLETGETDLIGRALPLGHRQDEYTKHIKELCAQAQEMRQNCLKKIIAHLRKQNRYSHHQEEQLQQEVADKLVALYRLSPTPGRFLSDLEQRVIASFTESDADANLPDPSSAEAYYKLQHQQMMDYNKACL